MLPPLILLERTSRWAAAFRREMRKAAQPRGRESLASRSFANKTNFDAKDSRPLGTPVPLTLQEIRSLPQCQRELEASPNSVVAVEVLPHNLVAVAKALSEWSRRFPDARFIALAARGLEAHELLLREAGAIHVIFSPRSLSPLLRLIRRHLARAPQPKLTLENYIWARLPWG